jgi:hypothetical protein
VNAHFTRRSALTAAVAAGLATAMPIATTPPAVAAAPAVATVVYADDVAAESRRILAEYSEARNRARALYDQLAATLSPEQMTLLREYSDEETASFMILEDVRVANVARHLPGLAPTLRMLWLHVDLSTECCTPASGYAP